MNNQSDIKISEQFLPTLGLAKRAGKLVIGWDRISEYKGDICLIVVSCDASERTKKNASGKSECVLTDIDMSHLGSALGIKRAALVAVTDSGFANLLKRKLNSSKQ